MDIFLDSEQFTSFLDSSQSSAIFRTDFRWVSPQFRSHAHIPSMEKTEAKYERQLLKKDDGPLLDRWQRVALKL